MAKKNGSDMGPNQQILRRTLALMVVCGLVTFVILAFQLFKIQILQHEKYEQLAIEQQLRETTVTAARGTIYDSTGTILAKSASVENVFISPNAIAANKEDKELIASGLSQILDVEKDSILEKMENTNSYYQTIKTKLEQDVADQVREFVSTYGLKSVYLEPASKRYYPKGTVAAHILGFVGADETGMGYGVEGSYDEYLTGTDGRTVRLKKLSGTDMLFNSFEDYYSGENGDELHLTIDVNIQQIMEKYLNQAVEDYQLQAGGFALAMNPKTGAILGMASVEGYDPNNYSFLDEDILAQLEAQAADPEETRDYATLVNEEIQSRWINKTLAYTYEPGSTFKLVTLAIGLEEGAVTESDLETVKDMFYCGGSMSVPGRTSALNCWKHAGHESQTLTQAIQHSCNVATVRVGLAIGGDTFYDYMEAFGLLEKTGIDLNGESTGVIWPRSNWDEDLANGNESSLAAASFGQTFTITPLQLVTAVSALSNGGYMLEPYVVDRVVSADGTVVLDNSAAVKRQVISERTSELVLQVMERVVGDDVDGTGKNAAVAGYNIGGKTGTSTDTVLEAQNDEKKYIVSFVAVAPTDDPEIVLLVALQDPDESTGIYVSGGQMAAPTAGKMLKEILPYLGIEPNNGERVQENASVTYVKRMAVDEARAALEADGFTVETVGEGDAVVDQMPTAGAAVVAGTKVILYLEDEKPEESVTVPDLSNMTFNDAKYTLELNGLYIRRTGASGDTGNIIVYKQSVEAGTTAQRGTVIEVSLIDTNDQGRY